MNGDDDLSDLDDDGLTFENRRELVFAGLSVSDMAILLKVPRPHLMSKIGAIKPVGERRGRSLYTVADCAKLVVKPEVDFETLIKGCKSSDLPPSLQKAFWDAQKSRQIFEERAGQLWHTHRVQAAISKIFMTVRQRLVLATDQIDRLNPLTDEQRRLMQGVFDNLIVELQEQIIDSFADYNPVGDRQELYENGPPKFEIPTYHEEDDGLGDDEELEEDGL